MTGGHDSTNFGISILFTNYRTYQKICDGAQILCATRYFVQTNIGAQFNLYVQYIKNMYRLYVQIMVYNLINVQHESAQIICANIGAQFNLCTSRIRLDCMHK